MYFSATAFIAALSPVSQLKQSFYSFISPIYVNFVKAFAANL